MAAWQGKGAASYAESLVNLVNPGTYELTPYASAPAWSVSGGWDIAGANFLLSGYYPSNGGSYIARFSSATGANNILVGAVIDLAGNYQVLLHPRDTFGGVLRHFWGNGLYRQEVGGLTDGRMAISGQRCFLNGSYRGSTTADLGIWTSRSQIGVGAGWFEDFSYPFGILNGKLCALSFYSCELTDAQVLAVDTEMAAL